MIKYSDDKKHAYFNGYTFTRDNKTGYYLSTKKITNKRLRLHVYIWIYYKGEIPKGYDVHHKNEDKYVNEIWNLELLPKLIHNRLHADEYKANELRIKQARDNIKNNALPKAIEWHKSAEGKAWHKKQYEENRDKLYIEYNRTCEECGKEYITTQINSKFCSNKCKSAHRRKTGIDNEERKCVICGNTFITNKYSKATTCSSKCRGVLRWRKK